MFKTVLFKILYYLFFFLIFIFSIILFLKLVGSPLYSEGIGLYLENYMEFLFR